ncbi:P-loop NTPase [Streptomyces carpaticus]|uniref:Aminoglycoside phosphotransferase domain-containing protein n=1 Tax=Streptomyces carpaticus TaxID=285558 RepID=A0ABV4ZHD2_9ACTN
MTDPTEHAQQVTLESELLRDGVDSVVVEALSKWQRDKETSIAFDRWLTQGMSGAKVASVVLSGPEFSGRLIMKVCPPGSRTAGEPSRHRKALEEGPKLFAETHLVGQPIEPVHVPGGAKVMFQEVAGGSLQAMRLLSAWHGRQLPELAGAVASSVLEDWNPRPSDMPRKLVADYLRSHLGTLTAKGGLGATLAGQLTYNPDDGSTPLWITLPVGEVVPNVVAWLEKPEWPGLNPDHVMSIVGRAHGDLHGDNILLPVGSKPPEEAYRLIDLSAYEVDAPLSRDLAHLTLSLIIRDLVGLTEVQRVALAAFLVDPELDSGIALQVAGLCNLANDIAQAGEKYAEGLAMADDWRDLYTLSLIANALLFATREQTVAPRERAWCYELACTALGRLFAQRGLQPPTDQAPDYGFAANSVGDWDISEAVEQLSAACERWSARRTVIAVVDSSSLSTAACKKFTRLGWSVVVELNPATDTDGGWLHASAESNGIPRLRLPGQDLLFGDHSTTWIAAAGLSNVNPVSPCEGLRQWRSAYLPFVRKSLDVLSRYSTRPVTVVCLGEGSSAERAVIEECLDVFEERVKIVMVSATGPGAIVEYDPQLIHANPSDLLAALPDQPVSPIRGRTPRIPAKDGPTDIPKDLLARFEDTTTLLHSEVGAESEGGEFEVGAFYRGRPISWFELDSHLDLPRAVTGDFVQQVRAALEQRDTLRVMLAHSPGAGGTTIARRVAWTLKDDFPTIVARAVQDDVILADLVSDLAKITGKPVLLALELVAEATLDRLYDMLRASGVPTVLLITARRTTLGRTHDAVPQGRGEVVRTVQPQLGLRVGPMRRGTDRREMAQHFANLAPDRADALFALAGEDSHLSVPFFYALTAFVEDFEGLSGYVEQFVTGINSTDREVLVLLALAHRFSGVPVPEELFAGLLGVPSSHQIELRRHVDERLLGLLVEESQGMWRLSHSLVAEEVLRQLLVPPAVSRSRGEWTAALPQWCLRLITHAGEVFRNRLPRDLKILLDRLFTIRDAREPVELHNNTSAYTELLQQLSAPGRKEVLHALVKTFPEESHYWGHYGRLLSYDSRDFVSALKAVDQAISIAPSDPLLHHMRGVVFRNETRSFIEDSRDAKGDPREKERTILKLVESARSSFQQVSKLDDSNEYGHITLAQMCIRVIEFGYSISGAGTYSGFLARPSAGGYRDLLGDAEEALDAALEIRGSDRISRVAAEAEVELLKVYDDYQALLQGWRNLLDRPGIYKPSVRRRLARVYRQRHGSWQKANPRDIKQAVELLNDNLMDNPRDFASLREWLQAARFLPASLDWAADYVTTWARAEPFSREALFYDYVLAGLRVLDGQDSAMPEYRRKLQLCRERTANFGNRRFNYEWLGQGSELGRLVAHDNLREWNRRENAPAPSYLTRLEGRVERIAGPASGVIDFGRGIHAFCVPRRANLVRGIHENRSVTGLLAFRYDGPEAWAVELS